VKPSVILKPGSTRLGARRAREETATLAGAAVLASAVIYLTV
jgi:hypothetical protein